MIKFIKITSTQYAALKDAHSVNGNYFYLLTDTNEFYLGERHLTDQDLSSYLTSVAAKDNSIVISNNNQVGVKLSGKTGNALSIQTGSGEEGLYVNVPTQTDYTVAITETSGAEGDAYSKRYRVQQSASSLDVNIDIPKDMVVSSGSVVDITYSEGHLYDGAVDVTTKIKGQGGTATSADAGKYIKLNIANATNDVLYIAAKDLVDIYTAKANAEQIQVAISNTNEISASIVAGSVGTTELASGVVTSLGKADSALQASDITASDSTTGTNGTFSVKGTEIAIKGLGSAAYTNSNAYDTAGAASTAETNAKSYADSLASNYATSAQGAKADTAIQSIATGANNGEIKYTVDGTTYTAVSVKGLDTAAYAKASDFDAAGAASAVQTAVIGTSGDAASANTIYGAKKYAESILEWETYSAS